ncbi:DNA translocase FtsK [Rhodoplanes azumiensis]|uniref:DNA translocase FtsK n=1 Tax=Rhodoplanes azumiensis TaxID=1897628 RepID=A0ABW5AI77_9BRAD
MPALQRRVGAATLLPDELRAGLERRIRQLVGLVLVGLAMLCTAALVTWSVKDPSLSHATAAPVRNLLGAPGAIAADLFMQLFGLATLALVGPVAAWGWRLAHLRRFDRERWRVLAWALGAPLAAGFAACLPRSAAWPLPSGLGGVIGDFLVRGPVSLLPAGTGTMVLAAVYGVLAVAALLFASGVGFAAVDPDAPAPAKPAARKAAPPPPVARDGEEDEEDDTGRDRASISLGLVVHSLLSLKARALRLARHGVLAGVKLLKTTREPDIDHRTFERREPRFDGDTGDPAERRAYDEAPPFDAAEEPEVEDEAEEEPAPRRAAKKLPPPKKPPAKAKASEYELPSVNLLAAPKASDRHAPSMDLIKANEAALQTVLGDFGVRGEILDAHPGPVVTLYELEPAPGIKSSRVIGLADDIARSMSAVSARVAVVPGRNVIGIELPNATREKIYLREMLAAEQYHDSSAKLPLCLGKTIGGDPVIVDLARMPHLLIAGTTGSGKSVAVNTMILSLLYRLRPDQCRLIMVDPKMLELSVYDGIPHLLTPVVTDPKKAVVALKWAVREMESRYKKLSKVGVRNIDGYNARLQEAKAKGERLSRTVHTGYDKETGTAIYETEELDLEPLPYIVVVVDEMADLMMVAGKDIEGAVQRLAQMARAAGIHVIIATQRPSVDVITGTIKANFPTRISFQVTSKIDSRTILGEQGAEQLLGQGDMLYMAGGGRISRVHGPFVSDEEVEKIVRHLQAQGTPQYVEEVTAEEPEGDGEAVFDGTAMGQEGGDLYQQAVQVVLRDRKASTSYIQRRLQVGYNKAASLMERMEQEGIVGQANHAGKREILVGGEGGEDSF